LSQPPYLAFSQQEVVELNGLSVDLTGEEWPGVGGVSFGPVVEVGAVDGMLTPLGVVGIGVVGSVVVFVLMLGLYPLEHFHLASKSVAVVDFNAELIVLDHFFVDA